MAGGLGKRRAPLIVAALLVLLAALVLGGAEAATPTKQKRAAVQRLLRLSDVGPGHFFLIFPVEGSTRRPPKILCGRVDPADQERKLKQFLDRHPVSGCFTTYVTFFAIGESPAYHVVGSGALDAGSAAVAAAGLAVAPQLLSHLFDNELPTEVPAPETVGDETRLFRISDYPIFGDEHPGASLLAWRSGRVLAAVFVQGGDEATNDREAVELARVQQGRIESPTPYTRGERYDREAGFEDPAIDVPIYWLGRTFRPERSLPAAKLEGGASVKSLGGGLPQQRLGVYYSNDLQLRTWTAAGWRRFSSTRPGREAIGLHCTKEREVPLEEGSAIVYSAYRRDFESCPKSAPTRHFAVAEIGDTVVAVDLPICRRCNPGGDESPSEANPYNSAAAIRLAVQALRPWPE
jgi:hypothetical protein